MDMQDPKKGFGDTQTCEAKEISDVPSRNNESERKSYELIIEIWATI